MKTFFAPSITLENGTSILTGNESVEIITPEGTEFSYRQNGGQFDECDADFINFERLIEALSDENWDEDILTDEMENSLARAERHYNYF